MITEQKGSSLRPIAVNDEFFAGISGLVEELREAAVLRVAAREGLSKTSVDKIMRNTTVVPTRRRKGSSSLADRDFDAEAQKIEDEYRAKYVRRELQSEIGMTISLKYTDGYSFQADTIDEIKETLNREPGRPQSLSISIGRYGGSNSLHVRLYNFVRSVTFELRGERKLIDHIQRELVGLLRRSEPDHPWLYSYWFRFLVSMLASGIALLGLLMIFYKSLGSELPWWGAIPIGMISGGVGTIVVGELIERAFPKCQFMYGPYWRRQGARRRLLIGLFTVVAIPLVLEIMI